LLPLEWLGEIRLRLKGRKVKEFHSFRLDTVNQCLWRRREAGADERIRLTPKAFAVLRYLADHAGRLVTQDELLNALWPDTYVQPEVLKSHILNIRQALGDRPNNPQFIETLPKRGYQFIAPVREATTPAFTPLRLAVELSSRKFVGRKSEIDELRDRWQKTLAGERQIVFITGEPGIGKTALADEFQLQVRVDAWDTRIARGQCVEGYGGKEPYYSILEALGPLCQGPEGESVVQVLATHAPTWLVQFPALVKSAQREILQQEILGATRERMLREIGEALEIVTSEKPLLLALEDLHWAGPSTVDVISALSRRRAPSKLMLIGTYRPADLALAEHPLKAVKQELLVHQLCGEIALQPLEEDEVADYLASESGGAAVPEDLAGLIYRQTEGNPLFMQAILEHMHDRGLIALENGKWQFGAAMKGVDLEVPKSLRLMIEAQIDRLSAEEQRVLEAVSLDSIGRSKFIVAAIAAAADLEPEAIEGVCEKLSRRHCILRPVQPERLQDGTVTAGYRFVHELYREVCDQRISPGRRANLHRRIGLWAEAHMEQVNESAAWLAYHFEQSGDWSRAIQYLELAADTAGQRFEPRLAADILEHSLELVMNLPFGERVERETTILDRLARIYIAWVRKATGC
jgi:predicted ATPase/DNA-binding winged helix-turn-helix (wHTH) protein